MKYLFRYLLYCLGRLPFKLRQTIGQGIGRLLALIPTTERKVITLQTQVFFPGKAPTPAAVFGSVASTFLESLSLKPVLTTPGCIRCDDWDLIHSLLGDNQGLVALTAHFGNWELLAAYMAHNQVPLTVVGREANMSILQPELVRIRESHGIKTVWRSGASLAKVLVQDLKDGRVVAALIDQDTKVQSSPVPFFGHPAQTPISLVKLAKRRGCPLVSAFLIRESDGAFSVQVRSLDHARSPSEILQEYHEHLEERINLAPSQWVWFHKRWRTLNSGERRSSSEYLSWLAEQRDMGLKSTKS